jgi:hypothetical protein
LAVEEQYYLVFPLFLLGVLAIISTHRLILLLAIAIALSLSAAQLGSYYNPEATFYLLPTRAWELFIGALIAVVTLSSNNVAVDAVSVRAAQTLSLLGLSLIAYSVFTFNERTPFPSFYALLPTMGAALVILFATPATLVGSLLRNGIVVGAGLISYSAYLWHQPLLAYARILTSSSPRGFMLGLILAATFILAYLTWVFVEQPFRRREKVSQKTFVFSVALVGVLVVFIGVYGHINNGIVTPQGAEAASRLQLVDQLTRQSSKLVRRGVCHYNDVINTEGVEAFLDKWDCRMDAAQPPLKRIPLIIVGDSLAADKVMALRLNGYEPLQIGGDGCSLAPKFMAGYCKTIYDRLYEWVKDDKYYKYIALANNLKSDELTPETIRETVDYWSRFNKRIIWFTNMPKFMNYKEIIARLSSTTLDNKMAEESENAAILSYLRENSVYVIQTRQIFCAITKERCDYKTEDGKLLLVDKHHLSPDGARRFGEILLTDEVLKSIVQTP